MRKMEFMSLSTAYVLLWICGSARRDWRNSRRWAHMKSSRANHQTGIKPCVGAGSFRDLDGYGGCLIIPNQVIQSALFIPSWRSLNPLKGSLNHHKKVTLNHQEHIFHLNFWHWIIHVDDQDFYQQHPAVQAMSDEEAESWHQKKSCSEKIIRKSQDGCFLNVWTHGPSDYQRFESSQSSLLIVNDPLC